MEPINLTLIKPSLTDAFKNMYLSYFLGIEEEPNITVNKLLDVHQEYDVAMNNGVAGVRSMSKLVFGIGNSGFLEPSGDSASGIVTLTKRGDNEPYLATHSNPNPKEYAKKRNFNVYSPIPLQYGEWGSKNENYWLSRPEMLNEKQYRLSYLKSCRAQLQQIDVPGENSRAQLTVSCIIRKEEVCATTEDDLGLINRNKNFNELMLCFGEETDVDLDDKVVNGHFRKVPELVRTVSFYYCKFKDIEYDDIPDNGIEFKFVFDLGESDLLTSDLQVPSLKILN